MDRNSFAHLYVLYVPLIHTGHAMQGAKAYLEGNLQPNNPLTVPGHFNQKWDFLIRGLYQKGVVIINDMRVFNNDTS